MRRGARFGRSLLGSSATSGSLDPDEVREMKDKDGVALPDALREHGVELDRMKESHKQLENAAAYLELHIEQGPVLERMDLPLGAVLGTFGVERPRDPVYRPTRPLRLDADGRSAGCVHSGGPFRRRVPGRCRPPRRRACHDRLR